MWCYFLGCKDWLVMVYPHFRRFVASSFSHLCSILVLDTIIFSKPCALCSGQRLERFSEQSRHIVSLDWLDVEVSVFVGRLVSSEVCWCCNYSGWLAFLLLTDLLISALLVRFLKSRGNQNQE